MQQLLYSEHQTVILIQWLWWLHANTTQEREAHQRLASCRSGEHLLVMRGQMAPGIHQLMLILPRSSHLLLAPEVLIINPFLLTSSAASQLHYGQVGRGEGGILSSAALCSDAEYQEGFVLRMSSRHLHEDTCSLIECKLGFTFWRMRQRKERTP